MVITCPSCSARYRLNPEKIKGRGAKITCPKCSHVFVVFSDGKAEEASTSAPSSQPFRKDAATTTGAFKAVGITEGVADPASRSGEVRVVAPGPRSTRRAIRTIQQAPVTNLAGASQPAAAAPATPAAPPPSAPAAVPGAASELDFREVGISTWKVKVSIGLVYDFSDISTLKKYLADKKVTPDDLISHNGKDWTKIGDIEDLDQHFIDNWKQAKAAADSGQLPEEPKKKKKKKYEPKVGGPSAEMAETVRDAMIQTGSLATTSGLATGSRAALKTGSHRTVTGTHRAKKSGGRAEPERSGSNRIGIFLVLGVLAVGGAWFALDRMGGTGAIAAGGGAGAAPEAELSEGEKEKIQEEIRRKIEEERQKKIAELESSPAGDEATGDEGEKDIADIKDRLVPVGPGNQRTAIVPPQQRPQQQPMQRYEAPNYNQRAPQPTASASDGTTTVKQAKDPSLMYLTAGKKKLASGDYGSAIQMLNQAVSKNPSCGACFEALYEAHKAKGNPEEAARALDKARSLGVSVKASQNRAG
jgi:predicted Zn finger-like uncharacterized protein